MKNIYILLFISVLFGCDNRDEVINNLNSAPSLFFLTNGNKTISIQDSVKISLKSPKRSVSFEADFTDANNNLKSVTYSISQGGGTMKQDNKALTGNSFDLSTGKIAAEYDPSQVGENRITIKATDAFNASSQIDLTVYAFSNLDPVASLSVNPVQVLSPYEYMLDASASYDRDQKYGGGIVKYDFYVNNALIDETDQSSIKYVFPGPGNYNVMVKVSDIDGASSTASLVKNIQ